jgi:hypothetical protein
VGFLARGGVLALRALHDVLVDRDDPDVAKNGFAQRPVRGIRLVVHLGQHDVHIVARPDQARDARFRVDLDADCAGVRGEHAGEEAPVARTQDVLRGDGSAGVEEPADQRAAQSDPGVGRIEDRVSRNVGGRRGADGEILVARQRARRERTRRR